MLTDIYTPIDGDCETSLNRIQALLDSKTFLAGLGHHRYDHPISNDHSCIKDFERSIYLMMSQLMHEDYDEKGEQYFPDILEGLIFYYGVYDNDESERRLKAAMSTSERRRILNEYLRTVIQEAYRYHGAYPFLSTNFINIGQHDLESYMNNLYHDLTYTCISQFITAAFFGGLHKWPACEHILECYELGALPTGWIGQVPWEGGVGQDCLQIVHFGPKE